MGPTLSTPGGTETRHAGDEVGDRLKAMRKMYGLSQRQLAERAGMTNGAVSLIEQNKTSPSVATLRRLLQGFPMSLSEFFAFDPHQPTRVFYRAEELTELAGGPVSLRQIGDDLRGRKLQVLHERYVPGADTGDEMLSHEGEEAGVVTAGRIELTVGGHRRVLCKADAYYFNSRLPHRFRNIDDQPCEIVSACAPPSF